LPEFPRGRVAWSPRAWRGALFWPLDEVARPFQGLDDWPSIAHYDAFVAPLAGVRFRLAAPRRRRWRRRETEGAAVGYDASICEEGLVPTRIGNWHDFFNALVWGAYPRAKRALHRRQYEATRARPVGQGPRSRREDTLALLDEGGVVLLCEKEEAARVRAALEARDDGPPRRAAARGRLLAAVFGHAAFEHLARRAASPVHALAHLVACERIPERADERRRLADLALAEALVDPQRRISRTARVSLPLAASERSTPAWPPARSPAQRRP
jgi:hypothetical protein